MTFTPHPPPLSAWKTRSCRSACTRQFHLNCCACCSCTAVSSHHRCHCAPDLCSVSRDSASRRCGRWCLKRCGGGGSRCMRGTTPLPSSTRYQCAPVWRSVCALLISVLSSVSISVLSCAPFRHSVTPLLRRLFSPAQCRSLWRKWRRSTS